MQISRYTRFFKMEDGQYFLVNGLSGAIDIVDRPVIDLLTKFEEGRDYNEDEVSAIRILKTRAHLTSKTSKDEFIVASNSFKAVYKELAEKKKLHAIVPTYRCNLRCKYCLQSHLLTRQKKWLEKPMSIADVDKVFESIKELKCDAYDPRPIHLFGGEPLLPENMELIEYILERGTKLRSSFYIVTNGACLKDYVPMLAHHLIQGIQVTLDGTKEVHDNRRIEANGQGTFDRIVEGIEESRKAHLRLSIRVCVDSENLNELPEFAKYARSMGWDTDDNMILYVSPVRGEGGICYQFYPWNAYPHEIIKILEKDSLVRRMFKPVFYSILRKTLAPTGEWIPQFFYCNSIFSQFFYDPHGDIYACTWSLGYRELSIGKYTPKLAFNSLYNVWRKRNVLNLPRCQECKNALLCGGGCPFHAFVKTKSIMHSDCTSFSLIMKHYIPYLFNMASDAM